ncbi:MAG TPA: zinc-binding alcohol dehydrogenase [Ktedonobacteraceae bacterium]
MHRQSLLLTAPRQLEWVIEGLPPLQPHEVHIQTTTGAISIGSELPIYCGTARSTEPVRYPLMTGYESAGFVISRGSHVQRFKIGDRVIAFYGHRTHAIISETKAISIPDNVSDAVALLSILTCDVSKGIRKVAPTPNESVLVTGAGTIGLLTIFILKAFGMQKIDVVEPRAERRRKALELGARMAMPLEEITTGSELYSVAFECSSHNNAFELLQGKMQHDGRICILSDGNIEPLTLKPAFHEKELLLVGSSDGWDYQEHAKWFFNTAQKHATDHEKLFDYQTSANDLIATFELLATGGIVPIKVLVQYNSIHVDE